LALNVLVTATEFCIRSDTPQQPQCRPPIPLKTRSPRPSWSARSTCRRVGCHHLMRMMAVGVRRNDQHDVMGEFTTDLLAQGDERAAHAHAYGTSAKRLGHSMALITTSHNLRGCDHNLSQPQRLRSRPLSVQAAPRRQGRAQSTEMHAFSCAYTAGMEAMSWATNGLGYQQLPTSSKPSPPITPSPSCPCDICSVARLQLGLALWLCNPCALVSLHI
jgi:hypothetical protein